jgi:spermidine synthase
MSLPSPSTSASAVPSTPQLHTNSQTRTLRFGTDLVQSSMRLDDPDELLLEYTRAMMGFLLFNPCPSTLLMVGLGGGSIVKYVHKHLPRSHLTVVEIEQDVIDLRDAFEVPRDDERLQVVCADGARFVSQTQQRFDVILVDGFSAEGQPMALCTPAFYRHCAQALTPQGLLVINMHGQQPNLSLMVRRVSKVFRASVIAVAVDDGDNQVVIAGQAETFQSCLREFSARWEALAPTHQATLGASSSRIERALRKGHPTTHAL